MTDNPNAFKLWFDAALVERIAAKFANVDAGFDASGFIAQCLAGLDELELKDRVRHITTALRSHLGDDYPMAIDRILAVIPPGKATAEEVSDGFELWPYCHYVQTYGLDHLDVSMHAMFELTQRFSAEFAVRPFLIRYPSEVLERLQHWTTHPNPHVRRWISEGTRPRLPWGMRLQAFVDDPAPILPLLEALRHDPEEYVRRSVANNLNDIAKDHPEMVVEIAARWWADSNDTERRMIKHALRTLVKNGDAAALAILGFDTAAIAVEAFDVTPKTLRMGGSVELTLRLRSEGISGQKLLIDYAIHHRKANGSTSPKVFKWTTRELEAGEVLELSKSHSMRKVTTRKYYAGEHAVEVLINGTSVAKRQFVLLE